VWNTLPATKPLAGRSSSPPAGRGVPKTTTFQERAKLNSGSGEALPAAGSSSLFGIVQGGTDRDLRRESWPRTLLEIGFDGYALGGLSVGEPKAETYEVTEFTAELLPSDRPRYLMGVAHRRTYMRAWREASTSLTVCCPRGTHGMPACSRRQGS